MLKITDLIYMDYSEIFILAKFSKMAESFPNMPGADF